MYKQCPKGAISYLIAVVAFVLSVFTNINVIFIIIGAGVIGLITYLLSLRKEEKA